MCNAQGTLSEACMVYLIDECVFNQLPFGRLLSQTSLGFSSGSAMATIVIDAYNGRFGAPGVSQSINASFHASALS